MYRLDTPPPCTRTTGGAPAGAASVATRACVRTPFTVAHWLCKQPVSSVVGGSGAVAGVTRELLAGRAVATAMLRPVVPVQLPRRGAGRARHPVCEKLGRPDRPNGVPHADR